MSERCEDCFQVRELEFQINSLELCAKDITQTQANKDIEHETMIQNLGNRMNTMSQDFIDFKTEIKQQVESIKKDIPDMFDNAVNKLLAKILKWLVGIGAIILITTILIAIVAFNRTAVVNGLDELKHKVETMEVQVP